MHIHLTCSIDGEVAAGRQHLTSVEMVDDDHVLMRFACPACGAPLTYEGKVPALADELIKCVLGDRIDRLVARRRSKFENSLKRAGMLVRKPLDVIGEARVQAFKAGLEDVAGVDDLLAGGPDGRRDRGA